MEQWKTVDEALDFAIGEEEAAAKFYTELADKINRKQMSDLFRQFAKEEEGHKKKLEAVKAGKKLVSVETKVVDLKIGDYLVEAEPKADMDYQAALVLAMQKEKKASKMYSDMAEAADDPELESLFLGLAQEEAKHKLRFEVEYDDQILQEN
jgi:rubrerythrin